MFVVRRGLAMVVAAGLILAPASLASAATGTGTDPTGDVASANDVTLISVSNSLDQVSVTVATAQPLPAASDPSWIDNGGTRLLEALMYTNYADSGLVYALAYTGIDTAGYALEIDSEDPVGERRCDATRSTVGLITTMTAPAGCFGTPARVDAAVLYGDITDEVDIAIGDDRDPDSEFSLVTAQEAGDQYLLGADGGVFTLGDAAFYGSTGDQVLNKPVVSLAKNPAGPGYWFVASDGGVFTFGPNLGFYGSQGDKRLNAPIVGIAPTPTGKGYWMVASDGGIFTHGDAAFYGSMGDKVLNKPIVGMKATPDGKGYSLVASDGGIFTFGTSKFYGSTGDKVLNQPIVAMATTPSGDGYWLLSADGGVFTFGNAAFRGSLGNRDLSKTKVVSMLVSPDNQGYRLVLSNGEVAEFGRIFNYGDLTDLDLPGLNAPIIAASAS